MTNSLAGTNSFFGLKPVELPSSHHVVIDIAFVVLLAVSAHFLVWLVRFISDWLINKSAARKTPVGFVTQQPKFITFTGLMASGITFGIYFVAIGYVLINEFNVPVATYLASASVIGLAVGFGSQGLVQDVVTSLTLILSDTLDVGDMIEVSGQVGRVEKVGLRFTQLTNFFNQEVFVPNRTIANVARFPFGGIYAYADVQIPSAADQQKIKGVVGQIAKGMWGQFNEIILGEPEILEIQTTPATPWKSFRVRFKIWPGQGALIETTFRQQITAAMKAFDPNYADWMVPVTYRAGNAAA